MARVTRRGVLAALGAAGFAGIETVGAGVLAQQEPEERPGWLRARDAVVRIEALGTYDFPELGGVDLEVPAGGSGFVIDSSGLAVTNNHVVTGAAALEAYVVDSLKIRYTAGDGTTPGTPAHGTPYPGAPSPGTGTPEPLPDTSTPGTTTFDAPTPDPPTPDGSSPESSTADASPLDSEGPQTPEPPTDRLSRLLARDLGSAEGPYAAAADR